MQQIRDNSTELKDFLKVVDLVAARTGIAKARLLSHGRGQDEIAHSRQLAMYLMHVALGATLTRVGQVFARDRTTVAYACARVEDRRDDESFDRFVDDLELDLHTTNMPMSGSEARHRSEMQSEAA